MAKCPICESRKGKRVCLINDSPICSLCCGNTRKAELCSSCVFYEAPKRKYAEVPAYAVNDMDGNPTLEARGNAIEGALCAYDIDNDFALMDSDAIAIIERLMDRHHFGDQQVVTDNPLILNGADYVDAVIAKDLSDVDREEIVKILGVIRFVAVRRTKLGREYMRVIHQYVGRRVGSGIRVLNMPGSL